MLNIKIIGGEIITPETIQTKDLYLDNGLIYFSQKHALQSAGSVIDATNCYITPGLFDLQVNGNKDCDLWSDFTADEFADLCVSMLQSGVTAFLPTLITADIEHLRKNILLLESMGVGQAVSPQINELIANRITAQKLNKNAKELIFLPGIHLEGPYLSKDRAGAHPPQYIRPIALDELAKLIRGSIKLMTIAPELENGQLAIEYLLKNKVIPSLGHSNATFDQANGAFGWGIQLITHIFNALPPIHQRHPGAVTAAFLNENVYCCVICDGLHVSPEMVKLLLKMKGKDRVILVTDIAKIGTTSGGLLGSSIKLSQAVVNIVKWGIASFPEAIQMATINPARATKLEHIIGQIQEGRRADLVIWDRQTLRIKHVIANGQQVF